MRRGPRHRAVVAVDIEASTTRPDQDKTALRAAMYRHFESALYAGGITRRRREPLMDRGDGILAIIHPADRVPKTVLLSLVMPTLARLLANHNAHRPRHGLRLRAVVHAGEVHYDRQGCYGEALDVAFRLLEAPELKSALRGTPGPLALVASDDIYRSIIRHRYDGIDRRAFHPLVRVEVAARTHFGWVHLC